MRFAFLVLTACTAPATAHLAQPETSSPYTVLHTLTAAEGLAVRGALTELDGRLYGLSGEAGPNGTERCNSTALWATQEHQRRCPGSLFSLRLDGSDFRVEHAFSQLNDLGQNYDGYHSWGTLAVGPDRRLYGTTQLGGIPSGALPETPPGYGVLFAYGTDGSFEILHHFFAEPRAADGEYPSGALAVLPDGVCGTTKAGGRFDKGTVWCWRAGSFVHADLPGESYGGVTLAGGLLHGTTWSGGEHDAGVYFTADPATMQVRAVDSFPSLVPLQRANDNTPIQAPLVLRSGSVVTAREFGGAAGTGMLAMLTAGGIWSLREADDLGPVDVAPRFANATGGMPNGQLVELGGAIYGTMTYGGLAGTGGIYCVSPRSGGIRLLWSWPDGAYPYGGLTKIGEELVGITFNTSEVFRFVPPAGGCR